MVRVMKVGSVSDQLYNHYDLLKTTEAFFDLPSLGKGDRCLARASRCVYYGNRFHKLRWLKQERAHAGRLTEIHRTRSLSYWPKLSNPFFERVSFATDDLIELSKLSNVYYGDSVRAVKVDRQSKEIEDLLNETKAALKELPPLMKQTLDERLLGVYLIQNLGSTAMSYSVYGSNKEYAKTVILLDVEAVNRKANEWSTWKESTPFTEGSYSIRSVIADQLENTRRQAIQYILLHEIGHLFASAYQLVPEPGQESKAKAKSFPFMNLSWAFEGAEDRLKPRGEDRIRSKLDVTYYSETRKKPNSDMKLTYEALKETPFPSLYASTNVHDDFAETFALYVHRVLMKKPWSLEILRDGKTVFTLEKCLHSLCGEKERIVGEILRESSRGGLKVENSK